MLDRMAIAFVVLLATLPQEGQAQMTVHSPDGRLVVSVDLADLPAAHQCPLYRVAYQGEPVVERSRLGLILEQGSLAEGFTVVSHETTRHDQQWEPVYGERSRVRDHYHQFIVRLRQPQPPGLELHIVFRVYDEGVAFCYQIPPQATLDEAHIVREQSEFHFPADHVAWAVYSAQGKYEQSRLSQLKPGCERPLTLRAGHDLYLAVGEARLVDYARMKLAPLSGEQYALVSSLSSEIHLALPLRSPWRVLMVAPSPGQLLENNDIFLNLNDPCAIDDPSWIRPGKVIREVTLTTGGGKSCVDFAAEHNLQFVEFDAGWYGHEYSDTSDAMTVSVDPKRSPGPLDLPEVIRYAKQRDIGIILYVNRRALERQLDEILPLYQRWGVSGVKYGFVQVGSQQWTRWLHQAVRKAAQHRLMVDIHDEYRPTGYSRTYPNLMTQEGIAGDETSPTNRQTLTILFTRMLAGAGDNTVCYYDPRVSRNACHAYQLAKAVCIYSPWQFLYWYDRPRASSSSTGGAGGSANRIGDEPELEFFDHVPTVWDDTRVIHGRVGQYAVVARRSGDRWFVGSMNADQPRTLEVPLNFLTPERAYTAHVYSHDPAVPTRTHVRIDRLEVHADTVLKVPLSAQGGQAMRIEPVSDN
jgi:alpha-glucosidase